METLQNRFGGGASETLIHPLVAVYLLIVIVLIFALPRGKAIVPFLLAFFTIPVGQVVVLGGFHFTGLRILILASFVRALCSRKSSAEGKVLGAFSPLYWVAAWAVSAAIVVSLQWMNMQAAINALGGLVDTLGGYLAVRFLVPDGEAVRRTIKVLAVVCAINGVCMINEKINHINVFGLLGGIPAEVTVRDGTIRACGVMGYIWAGTLGGVLIPLFLWLWTEGKSRMVACAGLVGATAMTLASSSSTSLLAFGGSLLGLCCWPLRKQMRLVRWGFASALVGLHLVMKAPVWALIARIDLTGSSSGDHRYHLVDMTIRHFTDWWLLGYRSYDAWGWDAWDLSNQFVAVALTGGLLSLICYIAIFKRSFAAIGTARKRVNGDRRQEWFFWCLGSSLFANLVGHFGINYPAHLIMGFFSLLICISVATFEAKQEAAQSAETPSQEQFAYAPVAGTYPDTPRTETAGTTRFSTGRREQSMPWLKA
jgi:hypothetical protein